LGGAVQAVLYFRRSLRLDKNYLAAWTLMGHEFIEMKNPAAAVGMTNMTMLKYRPKAVWWVITF
jgi:hypothetical protein